MNWSMVIWTALSWLISGGLIYLTYKFGRNAGQEEGYSAGAWRAWKNGALVIVVVFGAGADPDQMELSYHDIGSLTSKDWSRILGIFTAFVCAHTVGFFDGRRARRRR